uniref:Uncharacterized protein n=1 Tax=Arion vulgaris TaxID=1028688 RepID=A0A0B6Z7C5_9EUPU
MRLETLWTEINYNIHLLCTSKLTHNFYTHTRTHLNVSNNNSLCVSRGSREAC